MNSIDISWTELLWKAVVVGVIWGAVVGLIVLAFLATREAAVSFVERRRSLLISAGLFLGGIDVVGWSYYIKDYHWWSNLLLWVSLAMFLAAAWRPFIARASSVEPN